MRRSAPAAPARRGSAGGSAKLSAPNVRAYRAPSQPRAAAPSRAPSGGVSGFSRGTGSVARAPSGGFSRGGGGGTANFGRSMGGGGGGGGGGRSMGGAFGSGKLGR
jgi:hypothetical protein